MALPRTPAANSDWTVQGADRIESIVEAVRDKTTVPVTKVARAVVYGSIAGVMAALAAAFGVIALFRLHVYLPFDQEGQKVYATYFLAGAIFLAIGAFLWRKRAPRTRN